MIFTLSEPPEVCECPCRITFEYAHLGTCKSKKDRCRPHANRFILGFDTFYFIFFGLKPDYTCFPPSSGGALT